MKKNISILLTCILLISLMLPSVAASDDMYILAQPQNYVYNEGAVAIYSVTVAGEDMKCTWYLDYDGKTYNLSDTSTIGPWINYVTGDCGSTSENDNLGFNECHTTFTYHFNGCEAGLNGAYIYAVITNGDNSVKSSKAMIQLSAGAKSPPQVFVPVEVQISKGEPVRLTCSARAIYGGALSYTWYETPDGDLTKIQAVDRGEQTNFTLDCDTNSYGTRYYVCSVDEQNGGSVYSSVIPVTVMESTPIEPDETTAPDTEPTTEPATEPDTEPTTDSDIEPEVTEEVDIISPENTEKDDTQTKEPTKNNDKIWTYVAIGMGVAVCGMGTAIVLVLKKKS